jgi:hypothetical protein
VQNDSVEHAFKGERVGNDVIVYNINPNPIPEQSSEGVIGPTLRLDHECPQLWGAVLVSPWFVLSGERQWLSHS